MPSSDRGEIGVECDCCANGMEALDPAGLQELYPPLENVKTCGSCGKSGEKLKICSSCGEVSYTSFTYILVAQNFLDRLLRCGVSEERLAGAQTQMWYVQNDRFPSLRLS